MNTFEEKFNHYYDISYDAYIDMVMMVAEKTAVITQCHSCKAGDTYMTALALEFADVWYTVPTIKHFISMLWNAHNDKQEAFKAKDNELYMYYADLFDSYVKMFYQTIIAITPNIDNLVLSKIIEKHGVTLDTNTSNEIDCDTHCNEDDNENDSDESDEISLDRLYCRDFEGICNVSDEHDTSTNTNTTECSDIGATNDNDEDALCISIIKDLFRPHQKTKQHNNKSKNHVT